MRQCHIGICEGSLVPSVGSDAGFHQCWCLLIRRWVLISTVDHQLRLPANPFEPAQNNKVYLTVIVLVRRDLIPES